MINWDPAAQTALSDEEVIMKPQKGTLYYVRYEMVEEPGRFLEVATTRPETIMADTGSGGSSEGSSATRILLGNRHGVRLIARRNSDRCATTRSIRIRHRRAESDAGARQARF